jgi:hypothetical protein
MALRPSNLKSHFRTQLRLQRAIARSLLLVLTVFASVVLGCNGLTSNAIMPFSESPQATDVSSANRPGRPGNNSAPLWVGRFTSEDWIRQWRTRRNAAWGLDNLEVLSNPGDRFDHILRVRYPAGSASPTVARETGAPIGGAQFLADLGIQPQNALRLSYYVRFSDNFDFVKGGKLPGLFGGDGPSGGYIPNGEDGFSARLMWRRRGDGEVYAYLPTSEVHGTSIGRGKWRFRRGVWQHIQEEVVLNEPGQANGRVRLWFNGNKVLDEDDLTFRNVDSLRINGLFFSTFFGGGDPSWATPEDVYADFADFSVSMTSLR